MTARIFRVRRIARSGEKRCAGGVMAFIFMAFNAASVKRPRKIPSRTVRKRVGQGFWKIHFRLSIRKTGGHPATEDREVQLHAEVRSEVQLLAAAAATLRATPHSRGWPLAPLEFGTRETSVGGSRAPSAMTGPRARAPNLVSLSLVPNLSGTREDRLRKTVCPSRDGETMGVSPATAHQHFPRFTSSELDWNEST